MSRWIVLGFAAALLAAWIARRPKPVPARPYWWIEPGPDGTSTYTTLNDGWTVTVH